MNDLRRIMLESAGGGGLSIDVLMLKITNKTGLLTATDELLLVIRQAVDLVKSNTPFLLLVHETVNNILTVFSSTKYQYTDDWVKIILNEYTGVSYTITITYTNSSDTAMIEIES